MAASKRIGYAVVGLGHIAQRAVLPAFRHSKKSKLVALVSGDSRKAKRLASEFGARGHFTYDDFDRCLADPGVQAVYIATINGQHLKLALAATAAGKHVLCEKPLANTVEECRQMVEACRKNGVKLMTAYRKYFEPAGVACKKLIASGALGRLKIIHTAFTNFLTGGRPWHLEPSLSGGGSLMDLGVYCINTARWMTDLEPVEASGFSWTTDPARFGEVDESMSFQLKFPGGLIVQGSSSFTAAKSSFMQIFGEKGWVALNPAFAYNEERRLFGRIAGKWFEKEYKQMEEFHLELDHLAECIIANRDPEPDGVTGLRDVAVIEAVYEAARTGRPVAIRLPM